MDDEIFEHLSSSFPEVVEAPYSKLVNLDEDWMKSDSGKTRWREFMMQ
jgi:PBDC1 protein